jgi:hypothetical protein
MKGCKQDHEDQDHENQNKVYLYATAVRTLFVCWLSLRGEQETQHRRHLGR